MDGAMAYKYKTWQMPTHSRKPPFYCLCISSIAMLPKVVKEGPQIRAVADPQGEHNQ